MASEQRMQSPDDKQSHASTAASPESNDSCCASDSDHKGEPVTHPGGTPGEGKEQVEETTVSEGPGVDIGGLGAGIVESKIEEEEKTTEDKGPEEETAHQVSEEQASENKVEVPVGLLVSVDENGPSGEERENQGSEVADEKDVPQVTGEKTDPQVTGTVPQVTREETVPQVTGEQVADEELVPQKTDEDSASQATISETSENLGADKNRGAQVSDAGDRWLDMLVQTIVTEATGEGAATGAQVSKEDADTSAVIIVKEEHSTMQVTGTTTMAGGQVTLQGAGAAAQVNSDRQECSDNTDIALHVSGEELGVQLRAEEATEQVNEETTGADKQVEEAAAHREDSAGAQEEVQEGIRSNSEAGGQVIASGEETDGEVTPDLDALPGREGTLDQDQPVACREKEWPSLICTGSEVRTVTAEQGDTRQGSVTQDEPSEKTPEMKDREMVEDASTPTETPIEREIRLAMEREMSLRQERGISSPIGQPELVEVRRRTISVEPVAIPGKERQLAGAQMQREIQLETQREQDLVELGKVMGTYDRGPQQELQERKMIFESMNTEPSDAPILKKQSEPQQQPKPQEVPPPNHQEAPTSTNHVVPTKQTKKGPSYAEANGSNVIIIEHSSVIRRPAPGNTYNSAPADSRRSTPADFSRPAPADSRRSMPAEIYRTNSSEFTLANSADSPVPPGSPYQLLRSPSPRSLLEREIEEVKERERELRRQRSSVYGMDEIDGEKTQKTQEIVPDFQSVYQPERPNWGKLEVNWPPNKEAAVNGEQVLDSPRTRRQRSALIQSWESGNPNPKEDE
ncbi:uncharacterized protein MISP3 [Leptodactylus fuscus]|uniref:uncharacterized protein MISP3 n=1 Tax=Leptodactylus fuscus TaxID=238119 RepID=UPI003F4EDA06